MPEPASALSHGLVGNSPQVAVVRRLIDKAARHRMPVLLLGESGTGKEVVAQAIYNAKPAGRFVPIDCGSLVGTLVESELFGHVKGAFSGALENKKGLVELADGGTAFFDEIGDLPLELQVKLLRLLQEHEYRAVGSVSWRKVDIRVIAATHRDLQSEVAAGRFRSDLYYRLHVVSIRLPPLRERRGDIAQLIDHFANAARASGLADLSLSREIAGRLMAYDWPGNVRELKHCIERMAAMYSEGAVELALPTALANPAMIAPAGLPDARGAGGSDFHTPVGATDATLSHSERKAIERALTATGGERTRAAKVLGIGRTTLYRKMKQYGLA